MCTASGLSLLCFSSDGFSSFTFEQDSICIKDLNCKANNLHCTFHSSDPLIRTFLLRSYCLSLYGCCLWSLNSSSINVIEIALIKYYCIFTFDLILVLFIVCRTFLQYLICYIIGLLAFFQQLCYHHLLLLDLF